MTTMDEIEEILAEITARTVTARVLLRQDLLDRHAELSAELDAALAADRSEQSMEGGMRAPAVAQAVVDFEAELEAAKREFVFKGIGKRSWSDLLRQHPPTKEQLKANARIDHNPETFPAAAVAVSCSSPRMTLDQARALEERLDLTQWAQIWQACLSANLGEATLPKSQVAGGILRASGASASTAAPTGSPDPSSLDG